MPKETTANNKPYNYGKVEAKRTVVKLFTQEELDEAVKAEKDKQIELKDAYAETFEKYIPVNKLSEANEFLLSRFKDYKMSKAIVDRIEALKDGE